jgi:hypothetical protein
VKRKDLIILHMVLEKLSDISNTKFAYFIMKNMKILKPEIDIIRELNQTSPAYLEYENKRLHLCQEFSKKDEDGNPVIKDNSYDIENTEDFNSKLGELQAQYKDVIAVKHKKDLELTEFLMEECDLNFYKIKLENLPELSGRVMMSLEELIEG